MAAQPAAPTQQPGRLAFEALLEELSSLEAAEQKAAAAETEAQELETQQAEAPELGAQELGGREVTGVTRAAIELYPRFLELSVEGCGAATLWCLEHFRAGLVAPGLELRATLHQRFVDQHETTTASELEAYFDVLASEGRGAPGAIGVPEARQLCRELAARCAGDEGRARALLTEARLLAAHRTRDLTVRAEARALQEEVRQRFPDTRAAGLAEEDAWRLEHMSVGCEAPDFVVYDAAGNTIQSAHYRDQVVVVIFWEGWNEDSIRWQRKLVKRFWDERFTLIGVHTGMSKSDFRRGCQERNIIWTQAWERPAGGPATEAWHVPARPATYVLDAQGVLRGIDLGEVELADLIGTLLVELNAQITARELAAGGN